MSPRISPRGTASDRSFTATTPPKRLVRPRVSRTGAPLAIRGNLSEMRSVVGCGFLLVVLLAGCAMDIAKTPPPPPPLAADRDGTIELPVGEDLTLTGVLALPAGTERAGAV